MSQFEKGKYVILVLKRDIGEAISTDAGINCNDEGFILAQILRRYILSMEHEKYNGKFKIQCQESYVPSSVNNKLIHTMDKKQYNALKFSPYSVGNKHITQKNRNYAQIWEMKSLKIGWKGSGWGR